MRTRIKFVDSSSMRLADRRLTFPLYCDVNYWLDGSMPARCFVSARQDMFWLFYPPGSVVLGILLLLSSLFPFLLPLDMAYDTACDRRCSVQTYSQDIIIDHWQTLRIQIHRALNLRLDLDGAFVRKQFS